MAVEAAKQFVDRVVVYKLTTLITFWEKPLSIGPKAVGQFG